MSLSADMEIHFNLNAVRARVLQARAQVADEFGAQLVEDTKAEWTGFKRETGRSRRGWGHTVKVLGGDVELVIGNTTDYAQHVHRAGESESEVSRVRRVVFKRRLAEYAAALETAIARAIEAG